MRINYYISNMKKVNENRRVYVEQTDEGLVVQRNFNHERAKVDKVGKLHKAKRMVKIDQKRANLEGQFMYVAMKANRADKQREDRRAKRRK